MENDKKHKNPGFSVPNDYFANVENEILRKISPENHRNKTGFEVPQNYFSTIDDTILSTLDKEKRNQKVLHLNKKTVQMWLSAAAVLAVLVALRFTLGKETSTANWREITGDEVEQWTADNLIEFSAYEITEVART